jgi:hypothetical protein
MISDAPTQRERNLVKLKYVPSVNQSKYRSRNMLLLGSITSVEGANDVKFVAQHDTLHVCARSNKRYCNLIFEYNNRRYVNFDSELKIGDKGLPYALHYCLDYDNLDENHDDIVLRIDSDYLEDTLECFQHYWAARKIQHFVRTIFEQPVYKSGRVGLSARKGWENFTTTQMKVT